MIALARLDFAVAYEQAGVQANMTPAAADAYPKDRSWTGDTVFIRIWTAIGAPAITLPQEFATRRLSVGLQLVAAFGCDETLISVARHVEGLLPRNGISRPLFA